MNNKVRRAIIKTTTYHTNEPGSTIQTGVVLDKTWGQLGEIATGMIAKDMKAFHAIITDCDTGERLVVNLNEK